MLAKKMRCQSSRIPPVGHLLQTDGTHIGRSNKAPTEVAPSTPVVEEGETPSVPETPHLIPDDGATPPVDRVVGVANSH